MDEKSGPATLMRGSERIGGKLILGGRHLRFEPDGAGPGERLEVVDIKRIDRFWAKALGVIPVAPTGMTVVMRNQQRYAFTVSGRKAWIDVLSDSHAATPKG